MTCFSVLNPFLANVPILYPLRTPENFWFSGVFRGYKMGTLARNGLRCGNLGSQHLGKTWKTQGNFLENQSAQGKLRKHSYSLFQLVDIITMFGS